MKGHEESVTYQTQTLENDVRLIFFQKEKDTEGLPNLRTASITWRAKVGKVTSKVCRHVIRIEKQTRERTIGAVMK